MTRADGFRDMQRWLRSDALVLDDNTAERLLAGRLDPADAPPPYAAVTALVAGLRLDASDSELAGEAEAVAAFKAELGALGAPRGRSARRRSSLRPRHAVVAVAAAAAALAGTGGMAIAGALPGAAQDVASEMLERVGISTPAPNEHSDGHADSRGQSTDHPSPDAATPTGTGIGADVSRLATTTDATGVDKGAEISDLASDGQSQAGSHGAPATSTPAAAAGDVATGAGAPSATPPVETPNPGGTGTADTASGGASSNGTAIADEASGGRSSAGSGNATTGQSHRP